DARLLRERGWQVRQAASVSSTPQDYRSYIQASRGEFSCAKPGFVRLQTAWVSPDRTLCYMASGRPVVVEDTGPSQIFAGAAGLLRFRDADDAVAALADADRRYD